MSAPALALAAALAAAPAGDATDKLFERWRSPGAPGCAVAVVKDGAKVLDRAYGGAELEHGALNTPATLFEAGSASKQFTAAAVLLLARDGKLSLKDDVRRHVPELPDYGTPITVEHLLHHTSGLRDWRYVAGIAGDRLGAHVHANADALDIAARQRSLNHPPGEAYAYTNTGYTLLAILVERVSGQSLPNFTQARLFEPLGMRATRWRDDFRRVEKGRAVAYAPDGEAYVQDMPFENAYGAGGLLTTTGDMLTWNAALDADRLGVTRELEKQGVLSSGEMIDYARGLMVDRYRGARRVGHGGETAGYRSWVGRFPKHRLSIALLCNAADAQPALLVRAIADQHLPAEAASPAEAETAQPLAPAPRVERWRPEPAELSAFAGRYVSTEARATYLAAVEDGRVRLWLEGRPDLGWTLSPTRRDSFVFGGGSVRFHREGSGPPGGFSIAFGNIRDLKFERTAAEIRLAR